MAPARPISRCEGSVRAQNHDQTEHGGAARQVPCDAKGDTGVGDYGNNMLDLVANTIGSQVGVSAATRFVDESRRLTASEAS